MKLQTKKEQPGSSKNQHTKAQIAFEFVMLVSVVFIAALVFVSFVRTNYSSFVEDIDYYKLKDIALSVKTELHLATNLEDGYTRAVFIPFTIDGTEYNITKENGYLLFYTATEDYYVVIPPYNGTLTKGNNIITKNTGIIEVNP